MESFRKSIAAIKSSGTSLGTPDTVNDFMEELQTELQNANEVGLSSLSLSLSAFLSVLTSVCVCVQITDTLYGKWQGSGAAATAGDGDVEVTDEQLLEELDAILEEEKGSKTSVATREASSILTEYPQAPNSLMLTHRKIAVEADDDDDNQHPTATTTRGGYLA